MGLESYTISVIWNTFFIENSSILSINFTVIQSCVYSLYLSLEFSNEGLGFSI